MKTKKSRSMAAYGKIRTLILTNQIIPGQRLPLADLAQKLGMSRTPVNSALSALAREGFLEFFPNRGYSVRRLTSRETEELHEARELLELSTTARAMHLMTDNTLSDVAEAKRRVDECVASRDYRQLFFLDAEFHTAIVAMTGNHYLVARYRDLFRMLSLSFSLTDLRFKRLPRMVAEHEEILEAFFTRDLERAQLLVERHGANDRETLYSRFYPSGAQTIQPLRQRRRVNGIGHHAAGVCGSGRSRWHGAMAAEQTGLQLPDSRFVRIKNSQGVLACP